MSLYSTPLMGLYIGYINANEKVPSLSSFQIPGYLLSFMVRISNVFSIDEFSMIQENSIIFGFVYQFFDAFLNFADLIQVIVDVGMYLSLDRECIPVIEYTSDVLSNGII